MPGERGEGSGQRALGEKRLGRGRAFKMPELESEYSRHYSDEQFWEKLKKFALKAGHEIVEKVLILYYTLQQPGTPVWAKSVIVGSLGYFILPADAIPDLTPIVGFSDDLGVLVLALATVATHVTDKIKERAKKKTSEWLGDGKGKVAAQT